MPAKGQTTPKRHPKATRTWEEVTDMRTRWWNNETTMGALARQYSLSPATVYHILVGDTYKEYKPDYGEHNDAG